jgi:mannose-1-phosphate guanylyltransferase
MSRHWAVILAGGDGVRLRGLTRSITGDDRPKQFCALVGADALLTALAVLPVRGVHWSDLGDPERVLATRRRAHAVPMEDLIPVATSA